MHDKNYNGSIDLDECVTLLYARFGKVRPAACPHPAYPPPACRLPPPTSHLPPPTSSLKPSPWPLGWLLHGLPHGLAPHRAGPHTCPAALSQEVVDKRVREMFGQSDTEKNISFSKCAAAAPRRATPRPAAPPPRPGRTSAPPAPRRRAA